MSTGRHCLPVSRPRCKEAAGGSPRGMGLSLCYWVYSRLSETPAANPDRLLRSDYRVIITEYSLASAWDMRKKRNLPRQPCTLRYCFTPWLLVRAQQKTASNGYHVESSHLWACERTFKAIKGLLLKVSKVPDDRWKVKYVRVCAACKGHVCFFYKNQTSNFKCFGCLL